MPRDYPVKIMHACESLNYIIYCKRGNVYNTTVLLYICVTSYYNTDIAVRHCHDKRMYRK